MHRARSRARATMSDSFKDFLREQLAPLGHVTLRRMFRSTGVFCNGLMFGLIHDEALYVRIDNQTSTELSQAASSPPFRYSRNGRVVDLPYHRVPDDLLDQPDELLIWAKAAVAAAQRVAVKTRPSPHPGPPRVRRRKLP